MPPEVISLGTLMVIITYHVVFCLCLFVYTLFLQRESLSLSLSLFLVTHPTTRQNSTQTFKNQLKHHLWEPATSPEAGSGAPSAGLSWTPVLPSLTLHRDGFIIELIKLKPQHPILTQATIEHCQFEEHLRFVTAWEQLKYSEILQLTRKRN